MFEELITMNFTYWLFKIDIKLIQNKNLGCSIKDESVCIQLQLILSITIFYLITFEVNTNKVNSDC